METLRSPCESSTGKRSCAKLKRLSKWRSGVRRPWYGERLLKADMEVRRASRAESGLRRPRIPRLVDRKPHPQRRLYLALGVLPWTAWREDQLLSLLRVLKRPSIGFVRPMLRRRR